MTPDIMNSTNLAFATGAINFITNHIDLKDEHAMWIVVGSYVINGQKTGSDLDLIVVTDTYTETSPQRHKLSYLGVPVSVSISNKEHFKQDGAMFMFGGYFTGKLLNPHKIFGDDTNYDELLRYAGAGIGPFSSFLAQINPTKNKIFSESQIGATTLIAYMSLDPDFDSYLLSYFDNKKFSQIWLKLCTSLTKCLLSAQYIKPLSNNKFEYTKNIINDYSDFCRQRSRACARRFGFGVYCHNDAEFSNWYFRNSETKKMKIDPTGSKMKQLIGFLKDESGLEKIYY